MHERVFASASALLLALAGCEAPPAPLSSGSVQFAVKDYAERAPIEVAVLPVATGERGFTPAEAKMLRGVLYDELIGKGYSPLNPVFVDAALKDALERSGAAAGTPPAISALHAALPTDAFLFVDVERVDRDRGDPPLFRIRARAALLEGKTGTILFDHRMEAPYDVSYRTDGSISERQIRTALERYGTSLVGPLPARTSDSGRK
jgi:hypothetical protein